MLPRKYIVPRVIEMNYQAGHRLGVNVYLIDGGKDFILIDIGYEDTLGEIVDLIRNMDFSPRGCRPHSGLGAGPGDFQGAGRGPCRLQGRA